MALGATPDGFSDERSAGLSGFIAVSALENPVCCAWARIAPEPVRRDQRTGPCTPSSKINVDFIRVNVVK